MKIQLSDISDTAGRQQIFSLLFHGKAIRKVHQLVQIRVVNADDFIAEDVVQQMTEILMETENTWDLAKINCSWF